MSMTMIMGYKLLEEKTLRVMLSRFLICRQNYEKKNGYTNQADLARTTHGILKNNHST